MNHTYAIILRRISIAHRTTAIGRAVIHQDDLQVAVGLINDRVNALFQVFFYVIYRYDDRDQRHGLYSLSGCTH